MKAYLIKTAIFVFIFLTLLFTITRILSLKVESRKFNNYDSEESLFSISRHKQYDLLFMGISHARNFTRFKNQIRVEKILNCNTVNIARGGGKCGAEAQYVYLRHLYSRGNSVDKIIYVPTPPLLFSDYLDNNSSIFDYEPFRLSFFFQYLLSKSENKNQQLYYYIRSKFKANWSKYKPGSVESNDNVLAKIDTAAIRWGFEQAYPKGLDSIAFKRNKSIIKKTLDLCQNHNTKVIFVMTPAVFGKWPGNEQVFDFLNELKTHYPIEVYDYSEVCKDQTLYFDHHHLNSKGVSWFADNYLKPILKGDADKLTPSIVTDAANKK
jgi:hypothetical protein